MVNDSWGLILELVDRVVREYRPLKIILFGSHARGQARPDSDIDLLVIMPSVDDRRRATIEVLRLFRDLQVPVDVLVSTPEEIARHAGQVGSALSAALREGREIYAA